MIHLPASALMFCTVKTIPPALPTAPFAFKDSMIH